MKFHTEVAIPPSSWTIRHDDRLLLLGSCFADTIGARLVRAGFQAEVNPFGTLYNPVSLADVLTRLLDGSPFVLADMQPFGAEGWGSWMSHSLLSRPTAAEALAIHNERLAAAARQLREASVLLITFGTAWAYRLKGASFVANCHHEPAERFVRERLTVSDIVGRWRPLLQRLADGCPRLRVLFTVSPIRHLRDGAHANQLSKATLLLAVDELEDMSSYFPSYEIVLDELRDYRFYADDMAHPSAQAVDYIWERFADSYFDESTRRAARRIEDVHKALEHRPLHPESDEYRQFVRQTMLKIAEIQKEFPYFDAGKLIDQCHTLLNN